MCAQAMLTLCNPTDCSPPGCSVHGIFRIIWLCFKLKDLGQIIQTFPSLYFLVYDVHSQTFINASCCWASRGVLVIKKTRLPVQEMQETWVQALGGEDPLEEGKATHSSVLAWRIPWTEEPGRLQSMGSRLSMPAAAAVYSLSCVWLFVTP